MTRTKNPIPTSYPISLRVTTNNKLWLDYNVGNRNNMINCGIQLIRLFCERNDNLRRYVEERKTLPPCAFQSKEHIKDQTPIIEVSLQFSLK